MGALNNMLKESDDDSGPYVLAARARSTGRGDLMSKSHPLKGVNFKPAAADENNGLLQRARYQSGLLVCNNKFQNLIIFIIILNSITMGIGTFDFVTEDPDMDRLFELFDQVFLIIFTIEIGFHLLHYGSDLLNDGFMTFDFLIVVVSWIFQPLQAFRIIRAVRIVSRIKSMRDIAAALVSVIPSIVAVGFMLLLLFYIFGVMFTQLFKHLYAEGALDMDYFSRLDRTFFTLFQLMTLDSWSDITKQVMEVYPWAWIPFISFVMIASFVIINLIIAVICDAVADLQKEKIDDQFCQIKATFSEQNEVTIKELEQKIDDLTVMMKALLEDKPK